MAGHCVHGIFLPRFLMNQYRGIVFIHIFAFQMGVDWRNNLRAIHSRTLFGLIAKFGGQYFVFIGACVRFPHIQREKSKWSAGLWLEETADGEWNPGIYYEHMPRKVSIANDSSVPDFSPYCELHDGEQVFVELPWNAVPKVLPAVSRSFPREFRSHAPSSTDGVCRSWYDSDEERPRRGWSLGDTRREWHPWNFHSTTGGKPLRSGSRK